MSRPLVITPKRNLIAGYLLLVGLPSLALLAIIQSGHGLVAPVPADQIRAIVPTQTPGALDVTRLILQLTVVLVVSRLTGMLFRKIHQPQVVGEIVAGILLGPSFLGWAAPALSHSLFPAASLGYLSALSNVGLVLFMFLVGVSLNPKELGKYGHAALLTSHASIVAPFCLGSALALFLYPRVSNAQVGFTSFALFMGSALSITAFPVLARILAEQNLLHSRIGTLSIACAAVDDITGWAILAYVVTLVRSGDAPSSPVWLMVGATAAYILVIFLAVRPMLLRFETHFQRKGRLTEGALSLITTLALASALITEWLGIHLVFGAFLLGAVVPKSPDFVEAIMHRMESVTVLVLLPLFFAFSGLRTNIGSVTGETWLYALLIILAAIAGKFGGSACAARIAGVPWRDAAALGVLMNTRGLMELIVLNIGLDIGVISPAVFTIMVIMALVTTFMTSPLLELVRGVRLAVVDRQDTLRESYPA